MRACRVAVGLGRMMAIAALSVVLTATSWAEGKEQVLYTFSYLGTVGSFPMAGVTFDANGNLYGVTSEAGFISGSICCGTAFQLTPNGSGNWNYNLLHDFTGPVTDGEEPTGSVVFDAEGNLYGTTQNGGWCGVAYEISPKQDGGWSEQIIHLFNNIEHGVLDDGCIPSSYLIFDKAGHLYGTTQQTGLGACMTVAGCGTVFELIPTGSGQWREQIIHYFGRESGDGSNPYGGLVMDAAGNLWGTTIGGGSAGLGTIFELTPRADGGWNEHVAFSFTGNSTGWEPYAGLVIDKTGNLYGTTFQGGISLGGLVFKMTPQPNGQLNETFIHQFEGCNATECPDGLSPFGGLVFDAAGSLYGTTSLGGGAGGSCNTPPPVQKVGCGTVFKLTPNSDGGWQYSILYRFPGGAEGAYPLDDRLAVDASGNIYGTTLVEGNQKIYCPQAVFGLGGCGVVFEVTP